MASPLPWIEYPKVGVAVFVVVFVVPVPSAFVRGAGQRFATFVAVVVDAIYFGCYRVALEPCGTPSVVCCSRSGVKSFETSDVEKMTRGAYVVLGEEEKDDDVNLILIGTGSELCFFLDADAALSSTSDHPFKVWVSSVPAEPKRVMWGVR